VVVGDDDSGDHDAETTGRGERVRDQRTVPFAVAGRKSALPAYFAV
jgi:hypothetical protein